MRRPRPVDPEAFTPRPLLATMLLAGHRLVRQRITAGPGPETDVDVPVDRTLARPPEILVRLHLTPVPGQPDHLDLPQLTRPLVLPPHPPGHLHVPLPGEDQAADDLDASWADVDLAGHG